MFAAVLALAFSATAVHAQVTGAGSTLVHDLVRDLVSGWATQYGPASGGVTYEGGGSSVGVSRAIEQSVDLVSLMCP